MRFGHDVEVFLTDAKSGEIIPSCGKIGGSKKNPVSIDTGIMGVLEDNVALELNVKAVSISDWRSHLQYHRHTLTSWLDKKGFGWKCRPSALFSADALSHPGASVIGCSEDWDAFTKEGIRTPPNISSFKNERFTGGHIHVSLPESAIPVYVYIRFIAAWVTLPMLALGWDLQGNRRKVYGRPGLFRPTQYPNGESGFEYRAFSNFWFDFKFPDRYTPASYINSLCNRIIMTHEKTVKQMHRAIPWGDVNEIILKEDTATASVLYNYLTTEYPGFAMEYPGL